MLIVLLIGDSMVLEFRLWVAVWTKVKELELASDLFVPFAKQWAAYNY